MTTKYQQGGQAQQVEQQVVQLVQAAAQGDEQATKQIEQIMQAAQNGNQQAMQIAQLIQLVIQQMQSQKVAAKYGAKLNYIQRLRSKKYLQAGGNLKPEKKPINKKQNPVQKFRSEREERNDSTLVNGKYPKHWTKEQKIEYERNHDANETSAADFNHAENKKQAIKKNSCGSKMKKK